MPVPENCGKLDSADELGGFANQDLAKRTKSRGVIDRNHLAARRLIAGDYFSRGQTMLGKLFAAMIGRRIAGRNSGAKGAIIGYGAAALARRGLGPLAAAAAIGWGAKKLYERRRGRSPTYPSGAAPSSAAG